MQCPPTDHTFETQSAANPSGRSQQTVGFSGNRLSVFFDPSRTRPKKPGLGRMPDPLGAGARHQRTPPQPEPQSDKRQAAGLGGISINTPPGTWTVNTAIPASLGVRRRTSLNLVVGSQPPPTQRLRNHRTGDGREHLPPQSQLPDSLVPCHPKNRGSCGRGR